MKTFRSVICLILVGMLLMGAVAYAQEPPPTNACDPGGSMDGKCTTAWHWICGWYLARWEQAGGWNNPTNSIPDWCGSLLPPRPIPSDPIITEPVGSSPVIEISRPDTDGDGFPDDEDECPTRGDLGFGVDDVGCPRL